MKYELNIPQNGVLDFVSLGARFIVSTLVLFLSEKQARARSMSAVGSSTAPQTWRIASGLTRASLLQWWITPSVI